MSISEDVKHIWSRIAEMGTVWENATAAEVGKLYGNLHKTGSIPKSEIVQDLSYGPHERNIFDLYGGTKGSQGKKPVIVYVHGGGYWSGSKSVNAYFYSNIGQLFASHNYLVLIPNYQLVPEAKYPAGGQDVEKLVHWIRTNVHSYGGDADQIILIGQSSGAAHIASWIYRAGDCTKVWTKESLEDEARDVKGVAYLSAPFYYDNTQARRALTLRDYFGTDDLKQVYPRSGAGLIKAMPSGHRNLNPEKLPTLVTVGQYDSKEIVDGNLMFLEGYRSHNRNALPLFSVHPNHNHISNVFSVGTEDNDVERMLLDFIERCLGHR